MSDQIEKTDRGYDLMLTRLERWLDELAARGPKAMPEVYREMRIAFENEASRSEHYCEPSIDFEHQKNYN